jgi:hypothetical protein
MAEISNETLLKLLEQKMEFQNEKLEQILTQAIKTNGRVSRVEEEVEDLQKWQIKITNSTGISKLWLMAIVGGGSFVIGLLVEWFKR